MKKLLVSLICAVMLISLVLPVTADDGEDFVAEIGAISLPKGTPTIDGTVNSDEGWSEAQPFNKENIDGGWGGEPVIIEGNLWRAYDEEYLYIAADIIIPELSLSEGEDWIEGFTTTGNMPGWDGDVFIFSVDPMHQLLDLGYANDCGVWYCFGIFEGNAVKAYRTHVNNKEVSDILPSAGAVTENGWRLEAAIPWETICKDINDVSFGDVEITPEDILKDGNQINASMIYYDRRMDDEAGERITYSRYVSICTSCPDGLPGTAVTPWLIKAYGIYLMVEGEEIADTTTAVNAGSDTTTAAGGGTKPETELVTDDKGNTVTDDSGNKVTQKVNKTTTKKANTSSAVGGSAAQTSDIGIAIALGALVSSAIGIVASKKKR